MFKRFISNKLEFFLPALLIVTVSCSDNSDVNRQPAVGKKNVKEDIKNNYKYETQGYPGVTVIEPGEFDWVNVLLQQPKCELIVLSDFENNNQLDFDQTCFKTKLISEKSVSFRQLHLVTHSFEGSANSTINVNNLHLFVEDLSTLESTIQCAEGSTCYIVTKTPVKFFKCKLIGKFIVNLVPSKSSISLEEFCGNEACNHFNKLSLKFQKERYNKKESVLLSNDDVLKPEACPACGKTKNFRLKFRNCRYNVKGLQPFTGSLIARPEEVANDFKYLYESDLYEPDYKWPKMRIDIADIDIDEKAASP